MRFLLFRYMVQYCYQISFTCDWRELEFSNGVFLLWHCSLDNCMVRKILFICGRWVENPRKNRERQKAPLIWQAKINEVKWRLNISVLLAVNSDMIIIIVPLPSLDFWRAAFWEVMIEVFIFVCVTLSYE